MTGDSNLGTTRTIAAATFAMTVGWFLQSALSVTATFITDDLRLTRAELGILFFMLSIAGAVASPLAGKWADRSVPQTLERLHGFAAAGLLMMAMAHSLVWAIAAVLVGAVSLGASNPVSNRLVIDGISRRDRGVALGIKQSGPFLGVIVAGLVLPSAADWLGWRSALAMVSVVPGLALVFARARRRRAPASISDVGAAESGSIKPDVWWLAWAGLLVALCTGICVSFLPLYAEEGLGFAPSLAGIVASVFGLAGAAGRITWSIAAGRRSDPSAWLVPLAIAGGGSAGLLLVSRMEPAVVWLAVVLGGVSILSWHAVAWLTVLEHADQREIGRASAVIHTANLVGVAIGPPVAGLLVDRTGGYDTSWGMVTALFAAAAALVAVWRRTRGFRGV